MELKDVSVKEIEDFKQSVIWELITCTLKDRVELIRSELETGQELDLTGFRSRQAECLSLRYMLNLPDILIAEKKQIEESNHE